MARKKVSFRLSEQSMRILATLAKRWGWTKTMVIEVAIREKAEK